jgi:hypothetical protein
MIAGAREPTPCAAHSEARPVPWARLDRRLPLHANIQPVPTDPRNARRCVTHQIAMPELVQNADEDRREVRGFLDLKEPLVNDVRSRRKSGFNDERTDTV